MQQLRRDFWPDSSGHPDVPQFVLIDLCHHLDLPFLYLVVQFQGKHGLPDCGDVHGDWLLCGLCVWMDPGLFHNAYGDLDLV